MQTESLLAILAVAVAGLLRSGPAGAADRRPGGAESVIVPRIEGTWWQVAGDPDLGKYTSPRQQPVDFGVWQAADGTWQLWSCIRHTRCGGHTRLFHRWEGRKLTDANWKPMGVAMEADATFGETPGGLQAPHVIRHEGLYYMFYGDWQNICLATSKDGKTFTRRLGPEGKAGMFTDGGNTRDPMVLSAGRKFYCYTTAHSKTSGADYCRTSADLKTWSTSTVVARGGAAGSGPYSAECPHVVCRPECGSYFLFRTQHYGRGARTSIYRSPDPMDFGINDDRYFVAVLPVAAPEIILHEGLYYIASLMPSLKGIHVARLAWVPAPPGPVRGRSVFDFDDAKVRAAWRLVEGKIDPLFTTSRRHNFAAPYRHFIGTAESSRGGPDDKQTGVIESPPFVLTCPKYIALVSGGTDAAKVHLAVVDAKTGKELHRLGSTRNDNMLQEHVLDVSKYTGRQVRIRIVDRATTGWGHLNFGGLFCEAKCR